MLKIAIVDDEEFFLSYFMDLVRMYLNKQHVEFSIDYYTSSIVFNDDYIRKKWLFRHDGGLKLA